MGTKVYNKVEFKKHTLLGISSRTTIITTTTSTFTNETKFYLSRFTILPLTFDERCSRKYFLCVIFLYFSFFSAWHQLHSKHFFLFLFQLFHSVCFTVFISSFMTTKCFIITLIFYSTIPLLFSSERKKIVFLDSWIWIYFLSFVEFYWFFL